MKKIILIITFFITGTFSYADGLDKLSEGISKAILEKIPGEGHTELSIDLRNNTLKFNSSMVFPAVSIFILNCSLLFSRVRTSICNP